MSRFLFFFLRASKRIFGANFVVTGRAFTFCQRIEFLGADAKYEDLREHTEKAIKQSTVSDYLVFT